MNVLTSLILPVKADFQRYPPLFGSFTVLPQLDKTSPFVHMHPLKWAVNLLVLQGLFGWSVFVSSPSIFSSFQSLQEESRLQSTKLPLLLTNAVIPPSTTWGFYSEQVHFDSSTNLAVLSIADNDQSYNWNQVESAISTLSQVYRINSDSEQECIYSMSSVNMSVIDHDLNLLIDDGQSGGDDHRNDNCWIPIVYYADTSIDRLETFILEVTSSPYPPAVIIDVEVGHPDYSSPVKVRNTWVYSYQMSSSRIQVVTVDIDKDNQRQVTAINVVKHDLEEPVDDNIMKDEQYASDIEYLRTLADEAQTNDPVVGETGTMPAIR